jgi:sulfate adenylyltransferase
MVSRIVLCIGAMLCSLAHAEISNLKPSVSITLNARQVCDLELIINGGFAPLTSFMDKKSYESVVDVMRLPDGTVWPIPIVLDVSDQVRQKIVKEQTVALRDPEGIVLALLEVGETWQPDKQHEAKLVYGTESLEHPGVEYLCNQTGTYYVSGELKPLALPKHYDFVALRRTPQALKEHFKALGLTRIVGFQTRNPLHRAHRELMARAAQEKQAHVLLHPVVGITKPGDIDYVTRVRCYQKLLNYYPEGSVTLSLLPLAMRMAGPREALWHAIIRKNYGCTHFIVGRDHAGPGKDSTGKDFYGPYEAQELAQKYAHEIGIEIVPFKEMVYVAQEDRYYPTDELQPHHTVLSISGTQLRKLLREGKDIPAWFSYPEIVAELRKAYPEKSKQGFTLFLTGFSGSGKSTIAQALAVKLMELQYRPITLLDGDVIRTYLSSELGFSREHRSLNVRRVGFVAQEITKNGGCALCPLIAPYAQDRLFNRNLISARGSYIEIHVATPLSVCEERDVKGLYAQAREGKISNFTGINDPYEAPVNPEITLDTTNISIEQAVEIVIDYLRREKYIS